MWIDAGSRAETEENNGTAHFLEHLAFKVRTRASSAPPAHARARETAEEHGLTAFTRQTGHLEADAATIGARDREHGRPPERLHLGSLGPRHAGPGRPWLTPEQRENTVYFAKALNEDVPQCVDILQDILQNSRLDESAIERERDVILRESEEVEKQLEEVVFDHLHATAYQRQPLGRTILGPRENIRDITRTELSNYIKNNYTADRMVLAGAGGVPHQQLVEMADKYFSKLPSKAPETGAYLLSKKKPDFIGSDVRIRDDTIPTANIAIAVEGVSWSDPDYFTALVTQAIVGNYDKALGNASHQGSKLSGIVHQNDLATSYMSFSTSYSDTG